MTSTRAPTTQTAESATAILIDRCLPDFDVTLIEHTVVNADISTTWRALMDLDLLDVRSIMEPGPPVRRPRNACCTRHRAARC